ncbi:PREDICTED: endogenous retrovirus group K member 8 Gag polyprotein-like [Rhinopithecus bieti]|uniref:endogenous retrovirus group K member 8 Gag polyprotein-like n=1 Tax=Rhinopithecus bieti TaxID=61621 RepID=UPI00083C5B7A|nr:PREDICTED: endogenous retrovirus group K member 8 Gag polyprotein-like [Rhinopithecus bieti]
MGNSSSLASEYLRLLQGLLLSIGVDAKERTLRKLFAHVEQHCSWFQYQTEVQLNKREWQQVVKTLRQAHQRGDVMSAPLWALCASITQALELLETDSEKGEGGDEESLKSPIAISPPLDNSVTEGEGPLCDNVSHEKESEIQKELQPVVQLLQQILQLQLSPPQPSPPPTPVFTFPVVHPPPSVPKAEEEDSFPPPPPSVEMLPRSGTVFAVPASTAKAVIKVLDSQEDEDPLQLFPIIRQPFGPNDQFPQGGINVQYNVLQFKFLKEMKAAVANYGPQSPFVMGLLDSFSSENLFLPLDWETLGKAVLDRSQWLQLRSWWLEDAKEQARCNAARNPPGPTEEQLTGTGQFATVAAQSGLEDVALSQVKALFLKAWCKVEPSGKTALSFVKILQGANEPYPDFVARLQDAVIKTVGSGAAGQILVTTLAFENANQECQRLLRPLKAAGNLQIEDFIRACAGAGSKFCCP